MQNFNVDISSPGGPLVFYAMQADSLSRFFTLTITDNGAAWDPPSGALWSVRFGAPQMPSGWYDTIEDAAGETHPAVSVASDVATVEIAEQALSSPGQNILCVLVTDSEGYHIASWPIVLSIQPVPGLTAPQVTDYYNLLTGQVAQALANAQAAAASATLSQSWAVGGTGTRPGEDTDNAKYYAQQAQQVSQGAVGYYETVAALEAAHPTGEAGNWAIVGDSDTIYVWDTDTNAWVDTGSNIDLSQYYTKTQSDNKYALGTSGVANNAAKIQTPVNIGDASFDGSASITLAQIGALPASGGVYSTSPVNTGKTWIDGSPIYRKVIQQTIQVDTTEKATSILLGVSGSSVISIQDIVSGGGVIFSAATASSPETGIWFRWLISGSSLIVYAKTVSGISGPFNATFIIEYAGEV